MSIKGGFKELFVGKESSTIVGFLGKKTTVNYSDLARIEYCYFKLGIGGGWLRFVYPTNDIIDFEFNGSANEKIMRTIDLIEENNPGLGIIEYSTDDFKPWQTDWFTAFMMILCCMPVGLFLMWYYKKFDKPIRITLTAFFVSIYIFGIYASIPRTADYHITMSEYNQCQTGMTYQECVDVIGGPGELLSEVDLLGVNSAVYSWYGNDNQTANATFTFTNDSLMSKAQFGLE